MAGKYRKLIYLAPITILYTFVIAGGFLRIFVESLGHIPALGLEVISFQAYGQLFDNTDFLRALLYSLYLAFTSATLSLIIGVALAYRLLKTTHPPLKAWINRLLQSGLIMPYIYMVFIVMLLFNNAGIISRYLYNMQLLSGVRDFPDLLFASHGLGIILTFVFKGVPFITIFTLNYMSQISKEYEMIAKNLGADDYQILRFVYLPMSRELVVWSGMILFAYAFGAFEVPYLLSTASETTLSVQLYSNYLSPLIEAIPSTMALAVIIFFIGILVVSIYGFLLKSIIDYRATHIAYNSRFIAGLSNTLFHSLSSITLFLIAVIGVIAGVYMLLLSFGNFFRYPLLLPQNISGIHWMDLLLRNRLFKESLLNSLILGTMSSVGATLIGFFTARGIVRHFENRLHAMAIAVTFPLFIPGVVLVLGSHQILISAGLSGSLFGISLFHMLIALPYTTNIGISYFNGMPRSVEDAATLDGATGLGKFRPYIPATLIPRHLYGLSSSHFSYPTLSTSPSSLMGSGNVITLSTVMYPYIANADYTLASASGILFILVHLILYFLTRPSSEQIQGGL